MGMNYRKVIGAGLLGTLTMTAVGLWAAVVFNMRQLNPADMLVSLLAGSVVLGALVHLIIGVVLALIYAAVAESRLPGSPATRGAMFAIAPWLIAQAVVLPMTGVALFSGSVLLASASLIEHLAYGLVLGTVVGRIGLPVRRALRLNRREARGPLFRIDDVVAGQPGRIAPLWQRPRRYTRRPGSTGPMLVVGSEARASRR